MRIQNRIKLSIFKDERIVVENYNELSDINEEEIIVDCYKIKGHFLKIKKMDQYMIEVVGTISQIHVRL